MRINCVTMTGPDNSVDIAELAKISKQYPFVEWGILVSKKHSGQRFPNKTWLSQLHASHEGHYSMHVCGEWVRRLLTGHDDVFHDMNHFLPIFNRVQINTHGENLSKDTGKFIEVLKKHPNKRFIIQYDNVNGDELLTAANGISASPLFDCSHGAGICPEKWPARLMKNEKATFYCGYAGGLGPDNIEQELKRIEEVVDKSGNPYMPIWIDAETLIRSEDDAVFDLNKVKKMLDAAAKYVYIAPLNGSPDLKEIPLTDLKICNLTSGLPK